VNTVLPETAIMRTARGTVVDLYSTELNRSIRVEGQRQLDLAQILEKPLKAESSLAGVTR
jgi:hypothetical protein